MYYISVYTTRWKNVKKYISNSTSSHAGENPRKEVHGKKKTVMGKKNLREWM